MTLSVPKEVRRSRLLVGGSAVLFVSLFSASVALAQKDGNWLDHAIERSTRASAPWELPAPAPVARGGKSMIELHGQLAAAIEDEPRTLLEDPWKSAPEDDDLHLEVTSVDAFEDPWETEEALTVSTVELVDPWIESEPALVQPASIAAAEVPPALSYRSVDVIDPWSD